LRQATEQLTETLPADSLPDVIEMDEIYTLVKKVSSAPGMDFF